MSGGGGRGALVDYTCPRQPYSQGFLDLSIGSVSSKAVGVFRAG